MSNHSHFSMSQNGDGESVFEMSRTTPGTAASIRSGHHSVRVPAPPLNLQASEKYAVMVKYLFTKMAANKWIPRPVEDSVMLPMSFTTPQPYGVLLRSAPGEYSCQPTPLHHEVVGAAQKINVAVAFTMRSETTDFIFSILKREQTDLNLADGSKYQIVQSLEEITTGAFSKIKKFQYACLVRRERIILLWHDDVKCILNHGQEVEAKLFALVWGSRRSAIGLESAPRRSGLGADSPATRRSTIGMDSAFNTSSRWSNPSHFNGSGFFHSKEAAVDNVHEGNDLENLDVHAVDHPESLARPLTSTSAVFVGLAMTLLIVLMGLAVSKLIAEWLVDGGALRFALVAALPFIALSGLFFVIVITGNIFQCLGPVGHVKGNSRFYSAIAPDLDQAERAGFGRPHMTIQMPVYKESLEGVIKLTVASLKEAISHYELCGGTANIFVNDDGLQLISEEDAEARKAFYHENNIGWVARPKHGVDGFIRAGKFKKASNMNYALNISNRVEERLLAMLDEKGGDRLVSGAEEEELYALALKQVLEADGRAWAAGNIRVGEFILIIDSDTRVPADCLLFGAAEMFLSPEVAIIQHSAGVMQVVHDYFENSITFFTNLIYSSVRYSASSGEVAPFVGHNAFLRWSAIQSVAVKRNGYEIYWSESHVSEDFDVALRLQVAGNIIRLASYHGDGFKEGVSLTIYDELARWEKYAYGCNELVFHPVHMWWRRGPITPLFRQFVFSNIPISSKMTIIGYIATYYAIASGLPISIANYFMIGWYNGELDKFYMESWNVLISLLVVFGGLGNIALAILRYRLGEKSLVGAMVENFLWAPLFCLFFSGISFQLNLALFAHMFGINMEWGATAKELENSNFFQEVPKIFRSFKWMYLVCIPMVGVMIYFGNFAPHGWDIAGATGCVPLAITLGSHILVPFIMNPALIKFNY